MPERTLTLTLAVSELPYPVGSELADSLFEIAAALQDRCRAEALAAHHDGHRQLTLALGWPSAGPSTSLPTQARAPTRPLTPLRSDSPRLSTVPLAGERFLAPHRPPIHQISCKQFHQIA